MPAIHPDGTIEASEESPPAMTSAPSEVRSAWAATAFAAVGCGLYLVAHFFRWSGNLPPPIMGAAVAVPVLLIVPLLVRKGGRHSLAATVVAFTLSLFVAVPVFIFELFIREGYVCIPEQCAGSPGPGWYLALAGTLLATLAGLSQWHGPAGPDAPPQRRPA